MFDGVYFEDTWIFGWRYEDRRLVVQIEASLWPGHPEYRPPRPDEWTCYRRGRLVFEAVRSVRGLPSNENGVPPYSDASGERDFGSFNYLRSVEGGYEFGYDSEDVRVECETVRLEFEPT